MGKGEVTFIERIIIYILLMSTMYCVTYINALIKVISR